MNNASIFQSTVGTTAAQLTTSSTPNTHGIEVKALAANTATVYFGYSDTQIITEASSPSAGSFKLGIVIPGQPKQYLTIPYNESAANLQTALRTLTGVGTNVACSGGALPGTAITVTFSGPLGGNAVPLITIDNTGVTGGTFVPTFSTSLTTSNGFELSAGESFRFDASDAPNGDLVWLVSGSASQGVCAAVAG
jgi:hypothetical protein